METLLKLEVEVSCIVSAARKSLYRFAGIRKVLVSWNFRPRFLMISEMRRPKIEIYEIVKIIGISTSFSIFPLVSVCKNFKLRFQMCLNWKVIYYFSEGLSLILASWSWMRKCLNVQYGSVWLKHYVYMTFFKMWKIRLFSSLLSLWQV